MEEWGHYGIAGVLAAVLFVVAQIGLQWIKNRNGNGGNKGDFADGKTRDQCQREMYRMILQLYAWHDPDRVDSFKHVGDLVMPKLEQMIEEMHTTQETRKQLKVRVNKLLDIYEREHREG